MVTSDQIVGRPRTECAVASILTEPATAPVNWYTSVIVHIQRLKTYAARHSQISQSLRRSGGGRNISRTDSEGRKK